MIHPALPHPRSALMEINEDERLKELTAEIQSEPDPQRLLALTDELCRLLDERKTRKPSD